MNTNWKTLIAAIAFLLCNGCQSFVRHHSVGKKSYIVSAASGIASDSAEHKAKQRARRLCPKGFAIEDRSYQGNALLKERFSMEVTCKGRKSKKRLAKSGPDVGDEYDTEYDQWVDREQKSSLGNELRMQVDGGMMPLCGVSILYCGDQMGVGARFASAYDSQARLGFLQLNRSRPVREEDGTHIRNRVLGAFTLTVNQDFRYNRFSLGVGLGFFRGFLEEREYIENDFSEDDEQIDKFNGQVRGLVGELGISYDIAQTNVGNFFVSSNMLGLVTTTSSNPRDENKYWLTAPSLKLGWRSAL